MEGAEEISRRRRSRSNPICSSFGKKVCNFIARDISMTRNPAYKNIREQAQLRETLTDGAYYFKVCSWFPNPQRVVDGCQVVNEDVHNRRDTTRRLSEEEQLLEGTKESQELRK
jgi:hypothetical protein